MKRNLLPGLAALLLLLSGCASSARMMRMSGGVMESYAPPEKHRLRSEKYRQSSVNFAPRDERKAQLDTKASLINLWPFFFRSNQYFSILWPLADWDPYGMAIRPFFNHEGDDYSILFPWCAWNTADGSGWCCPVVWNRQRIMAFPLFYHAFGKVDEGLCYYTPLCVRSWNRSRKPDWTCPAISKETGEFCLAYWEKSSRYDTDNSLAWAYVWHGDHARLRGELRYRGVKIDEGKAAADRYTAEAWKNLPVTKSGGYGFFPLFHRYWSKDENSLRLLLLAYGEQSADHQEYGFGGAWFGKYSATQCNWKNRYRGTGWKYDAWLLLSRFVCDKHFTGAQYQAAKELDGSLADLNSTWVKRRLQTMGAVLPSGVIDQWSYKVWLEDWCKAQKFPVETNYYGGFLPLFNYSYTASSAKWFSPVLMTYYNGKKDSTFWWSLPLLSVSSKEPQEEIFTTAGPLLYFSKTIRVPQTKAGEKKIHSRSTLWTDERHQTAYTHRYALCGLFYRGNDTFFVEKAGLPEGVAEKVRFTIGQLYDRNRSISRQQKYLDERKSRNDARKIANKAEHFDQLAENERIKMVQKELDDKRRVWMQDVEKLKLEAKKIDFVLPPDFAKDEKSKQAVQQALISQCAEARQHFDIGGGIIFHKELFYNGDMKWNFCWFLAGGEKRGDYEKTQILQLLYRHIRQGEKSETLFFPFITVRHDGDDSQYSFMWRIFNLERRKGKWGGHIFLIPFGRTLD